ncbi:DUF1566 domain-containing protein [Aliarcobacter cryaerophilus]|uniref:Lcl C-terminal domain-containing protein n=1 Tax=Aliarcobacter cryaerophilus TaxID=28198 RepID=UPI003DA4238B
MNNNLTTTKQNAKLALAKSKSLLDITNKIINKNVNDKVWIDTDTSLTWQIEVDGKKYTWDEAFEYIQKLNNGQYCGYEDWRIPTLDELNTIVTKESYKSENGYEYKIKKNLLKSMCNNDDWASYWSSTALSRSSAYYLSFMYGREYDIQKNKLKYIRCVRGGNLYEWMDKIFIWADNNNISNEKIPRNKNDLLNLTNLDLSNLELTELPSEFSMLKYLRSLNLNNNDLRFLPTDLIKNIDINTNDRNSFDNGISLRIAGNKNLTLTDEENKIIEKFKKETKYYKNSLLNYIEVGSAQVKPTYIHRYTY